ncbi:hypothetical protein [Clostridium sp. YIM B02569]|uniref:hypothetical protein n=1 Tax=Clostridium sp. YIM B02569 TaxID=2911967 RepID=UPI001EEF35AF|nr:hypothetical protein [Clostridium sp. YIM B02569]
MANSEMLNSIRERFTEDTKEKSKLVYNRKIEIFIEYLEEECGVNDKNYKETLIGLGRDKIIKSMEYYIQNYGIQYKSTIDSYITVIKVFFGYLSKRENIYNKLFDRQAEIEKLNKEVESKAKELKLNPKQMKEPIEDDEFEQLLIACENAIKSYSVENYISEGSYKTDTGMFISAIIMELVMFTGIKNSVVSTILKKDYSYDLNKITINGISINLPDNLAINFKKYYSCRSEILKYNNKEDNFDKCLFITQNGEFMEEAASGDIYKVMKKELNTVEGEGLCKYAVMKHIEEGIDVLEIMDLSGLGIDTCMHCREQLNLSKNKKRMSRINSKLRNSELYRRL